MRKISVKNGDDLAPGDKVKLIKTKRKEWAFKLGKEATVTTISGANGTVSVEFKDGGTAGFPADSLQKI